MKRLFLIVLGILLVVSLTATAGCAKKSITVQQPQKQKTEVLKGVAALVNGQKIMIKDVEADFSRQNVSSLTAEQQHALRLSILDSKIDDIFYESALDKIEVRVPDEAVEKELDKAKANYQTEDAFEQFLINNKYTLDEYKAYLRTQLLRIQVGNTLLRKNEMPADQAEQYFNEHPEKFSDLSGLSFASLSSEQRAKVMAAAWVAQERSSAMIQILMK